MERVAEKVEKLNRLSGEILDASIEVHRVLGGPGLLESIYEEALARELSLRGIEVQRQVQIPVAYKGAMVRDSLVLDLLVAGKVIVEVKSVEKFNPIFASQLLTYLRLSNNSLGIIVNFGEKFVKDGFHRVVNRFPV
ncbi:GxxExxY protein [Geothermobacter hydrogeniphilus]|uniref:GxxExxY protein n=1 Tax=Geothermobacter hydrogeniphilus TaxID=1969733 RepID=A0A2K2HEH5_9BACT|nr:GxxExxY protein [Geothermobacter hydrogeniphilus]PNU21653.1 GxxExxY protein [Geothermobacter hydrogeniphilus]